MKTAFLSNWTHVNQSICNRLKQTSLFSMYGYHKNKVLGRWARRNSESFECLFNLKSDKVVFTQPSRTH